MKDEKIKLKRFALTWSATVSGTQYVDAFDEGDAADQFDRVKHEGDLPDEPIYADLEEVIEVRRITHKLVGKRCLRSRRERKERRG